MSSTKSRERRPLRGRYEARLVPLLDAFELLGVGKTRGYELVALGLLPTVKLGARRYATREGLDSLVRALEEGI